MFALTRRHRAIDIWPGFVDALASVLLVFIFMLLIFVVAQFYLSGILAGRDAALQRLTASINELADTLALERERGAELAATVESLEGQLRATLAEKGDLELRLGLALDRAKTAEGHVRDLEKALGEAERTIAADRETIELRLREIASLQQDIAALREVRDDLEARVAELGASLEERTSELGAERDRRTQLEARLAEESERTVLAQREIEQRDIRIADLVARIGAQEEAIAAEQTLSRRAQSRVEELNQQIGALRAQLSELSAALDLAEGRVRDQQVEIADLGKRLNLALARKVEELNRYRSEFFGRLREVLGEREDVRIVGDRFVFQSEVLFDTASAEIGPEGQRQIARLADSLKEVMARIPSEIDWVLRIDGHTDRRPIRTEQFPSNWELSTARALAIVRLLSREGIPPRRLVAAGFGEQRPLDTANTPRAWRRNRRIEIKMTMP